MRTKYIYITALIIILTIKAIAQQQPFYTQYVLNPFVSNPALAGIENYWDVKLSYRNQWQGIDNAPQTTYLTIQGPLKKVMYNKVTTSTVPPPERKKIVATNYWLQYKSIIPHAGLGFTFLNDKAGPIHRYAVSTTYAYHIGLSPKMSLGAGLAGGVQGISLNTDQLNFGVSNPVDPSVNVNGVVREIKPDISVGLWLYSAFYFVGASAQNLIPLKLHYSDSPVGNELLVPHITMSAGYKIFVNDMVTFLPSTMVRLVNNAPINIDINAKLQYHDVAWVGISYRHAQSFATMIGMNVNSTLNFGYSYDIVTSNIKYVTNGTHELVLGILLGNRNRVACPRDFW